MTSGDHHLYFLKKSMAMNWKTLSAGLATSALALVFIIRIRVPSHQVRVAPVRLRDPRGRLIGAYIIAGKA